MKKKTLSIILILCLVLGMSVSQVFADPEDEETESWETESEETENSEEESTGEENEYTGEYAEDYSEEEAAREEEEWQEEYWEPEPEYSEEAEAVEEEKEEQPILPIVAPDGSIRKPVLSSGAAAVYCKNTGELIFAKNADKRFSPYSITKLLTALLAVQKLPMNQVVTISEKAAGQDGSSMDLYPGEEVTVEQLLYGTMILSGNDAAYALAEAVSGDVDTFVDLMNETVKNLGCKNTHFVNPNGLIDDVSKQYTTAKDFLEISKLAFANDTLRIIAGANEYDMPATNMSDAYKMKGHNELLLEGKEGYIAGKTGYWDDTKSTIAMDYMEGTLELIVIALGGDIDKRGTDCDQLIEYAVASVEGLKIVEPGQVVSSVRVKRGAVTKTEAVTAGESFIYLPKQASKELIQLVAVLDENLTAPVKAGDPVGVYEVYLADEKIDEVPLIAGFDVEEGWLLSRLGLSNRATLILGFVLLVLIFFMILRSINKSRMKRRKRQAHRDKIRNMAQEELEKEKKEFESYKGRYYN